MTTYGERVGQAAEQLARDGDVMINELVPLERDVMPNQTVSLHVAMLDRDGSRFGCIFCRLLDVLVQAGHCEAVLSDAPLPWWVYPRAAFWFLFCLCVVPLSFWRGGLLGVSLAVAAAVPIAALGWLIGRLIGKPSDDRTAA